MTLIAVNNPECSKGSMVNGLGIISIKEIEKVYDKDRDFIKKLNKLETVFENYKINNRKYYRLEYLILSFNLILNNRWY
ncbi:MAG: hypothetical protein ACTSPQ_17665 [Candidatus Helarchaeota archaeon]